MISEKDIFKVSFPTRDGGIENLHVLCKDGHLIVYNSPFYVYDISYKDEISTKIFEDRLFFDKVIKRGGHSTYRVLISPIRDEKYFLDRFECISVLGCTFEGAVGENYRLYSIDVPPHADIYKVYDELQKYEESGEWVFEEAHCFRPC